MRNWCPKADSMPNSSGSRQRVIGEATVEATNDLRF